VFGFWGVLMFVLTWQRACRKWRKYGGVPDLCGKATIVRVLLEIFHPKEGERRLIVGFFSSGAIESIAAFIFLKPDSRKRMKKCPGHSFF
jgi:hypothetical protein